MAKFIKIRGEIINLDHTQEISTFVFQGVRHVCFYGDSVIEHSNRFTEFDGDDAEIVWDWLNEHLDMSVIPMPQEVKA